MYPRIAKRSADRLVGLVAASSMSGNVPPATKVLEPLEPILELKAPGASIFSEGRIRLYTPVELAWTISPCSDYVP